jgi:predicted DNA-binding transcriptional regulator YafY
VAARRVAQRRLEDAIGGGFGIFGGRAKQRARLRFSPAAARWIADEVWHPQQTISRDGDHLIIDIPYAQSRELIMEILRHGSDVEVLSPSELRAEVRNVLQKTLAVYGHRPAGHGS